MTASWVAVSYELHGSLTTAQGRMTHSYKCHSSVRRGSPAHADSVGSLVQTPTREGGAWARVLHPAGCSTSSRKAAPLTSRPRTGAWAQGRRRLATLATAVEAWRAASEAARTKATDRIRATVRFRRRLRRWAWAWWAQVNGPLNPIKKPENPWN
jgi:hypothetical protein